MESSKAGEVQPFGAFFFGVGFPGGMDDRERDPGVPSGREQFGLDGDGAGPHGGVAAGRIDLGEGAEGKVDRGDRHAAIPGEGDDVLRLIWKIEDVVEGGDRAGGELQFADAGLGESFEIPPVHRAGTDGEGEGPVFSVCHGKDRLSVKCRGRFGSRGGNGERRLRFLLYTMLA